MSKSKVRTFREGQQVNMVGGIPMPAKKGTHVATMIMGKGVLEFITVEAYQLVKDYNRECQEALDDYAAALTGIRAKFDQELTKLGEAGKV